MGGQMQGWIVAHFTQGIRIKAWDQWSQEEKEEDEWWGDWEDVSAAIEFKAGKHGDGVDGGPVEGRERQRKCVYEIESEDCVITGGRSTYFNISSCAIHLVNVAQCKCKR